MTLRPLTEGDVHAVCRQVSVQADPTVVRRVLVQAESAASQSVGDPVRTYAAALIQQVLEYRPVPSRNSVVGWGCAVLALNNNGFSAKQGFDPSAGLQSLVAATQAGTLVLRSVLDLIDDAIA